MNLCPFFPDWTLNFSSEQVSPGSGGGWDFLSHQIDHYFRPQLRTPRESCGWPDGALLPCTPALDPQVL